jgi:cytochrome P450
VDHASSNPYSPLDVAGPRPLDMVRGIRTMLRDPLSWLEQVVADHGDLVALPLPRTPVLLVNTPAGAGRVLRENHPNYTKQTVQYGALSLVTGAGLLTSDGPGWRRHRRVVQPAFHHAGLERVAEATVEAAQGLRRRWDAAGPGTALDADAATMETMLEVVGRSLFADDLAADSQRVVAAVDEALRLVLARARSPLAGLVPSRVPTPSRRRLRRAVATLDEVCAQIVRRRREEPARPAAPDCPASPEQTGNDVLSALLGSGLDDREIRDELVTLVIAGHETVASCLVWTLHLLATDQQAQKHLHAELDEVLAGRTPGWSDVRALVRTRAVIDESLRLYPPAWVISRRAVGADEIDGVAVPAGTLVLISPWLLHRRAQEWPDPRHFDPDRFLTPSAGSGRRDGYLPFGAGPRLCIGREFARTEATLVLAALLRDRAVRHPVDAPEPEVDALVTLRPRGGLPLLLDPR